MSEAAKHTRDGGPAAFPIAVPNAFKFAEHGMSLRDYFAAKAMQQLVSLAAEDGNFTVGGRGPLACAMLAVASYAVADAMLAARLPADRKE